MEVQLQSVLLQQDNICGITDMYYHDAFGRLTFNGYLILFISQSGKIYESYRDHFKNPVKRFQKAYPDA